jgi:DNA modification methylase/transcriptional regulator with XRE-family HTH domain
MNFAAFIKTKRSDKGMSLRETAALVGVNAAYLSRVEGGKVPPSDHLIDRLAEVLDCSSDELAIMVGRLPPTVRISLDGQQPYKAVAALRHLAAITAAEPTTAHRMGVRDADVPAKGRKGKRSQVARASTRRRAKDAEALPLFPETGQPLVRAEPVDDTGEATDQETAGPRRVDPRNRLNALTSKEWVPETVSVWTQRGLGAGHPDAQIERQHPAPFSFTDVSRLVRFFSKPGDTVLDPFVGVGSTLKACALEGRRGIGIELNPKYADLARRRLDTEIRDLITTAVDQKIIEGDARDKLRDLADRSVDFVVTSPPYWNILHKEDHKARQERKDHDLDTRYGDDKRDLGNVGDYGDFLKELSTILGECARTLKPKKYMTVIVSDFRDKSRFIMFHADLAAALGKFGLELRGLKVLYQRHKKIFPYGYPYAYVPNIHHQYILILQNGR